MSSNIFIYAPDIHEGDAVGNHCLGLANVCERLGYRVALFAQRHSTQLQVRVINDAEKLTSVIAEDDILLVSYSIYDSLLTELLALPCKKIAYYHDVTPPCLLEDYEPVTARLCESAMKQLPQMAGFTHLVATSTFSAACLKRYVPDREMIIIPPVFNDFGLLKYPANDRSAIQDKYVDLLYVGRVVPHKRIEDLIQTFSLLPTADDAVWRLHIVGNMPNYDYNKMLYNLASKLGVATRISFTGAISDTDLLERFHKADIYLTMSLHEGFCIPVLEAMHFGMPVLARKGTAADDLLDILAVNVESVTEAAMALQTIHAGPSSPLLWRQRAAYILEQTSDEIWGAVFSSLTYKKKLI